MQDIATSYQLRIYVSTRPYNALRHVTARYKLSFYYYYYYYYLCTYLYCKADSYILHAANSAVAAIATLLADKSQATTVAIITRWPLENNLNV